MRIDHVIIGGRDIGELRRLLWDRYGFGVIRGSAHEDGTQGWLVPFDTPRVQYLELLTPGDMDTLAASEFGRLFLERTASGPAFLNWALLSDDIAKDAARIHELTAADPGLLRGESVRADGQRSGWAEAGFAASWQCPSRPFFLEYGNQQVRAARVSSDVRLAGHRRVPTEIRGITLRSACPDLAAWWGEAALPAVVSEGSDERILAVLIRTRDGEVEVVLP
jgi:hypothetical protein